MRIMLDTNVILSAIVFGGNKKAGKVLIDRSGISALKKLLHNKVELLERNAIREEDVRKDCEEILKILSEKRAAQERMR